jgi:hypothetical protein
LDDPHPLALLARLLLFTKSLAETLIVMTTTARAVVLRTSATALPLRTAR